MRRYLVLATALLATAAVGSASASQSTTRPYLGTWGARLSYDQMVTNGFDVRLAGSFRLVLRPNGTYTTSNSFDGPSRGRFAVSGKRIRFSDDVGCKAGGFETSNGALYTWSLEGRKLRLASVTVGGDRCGGRWQTLTYPLWKRIS